MGIVLPLRHYARRTSLRRLTSKGPFETSPRMLNPLSFKLLRIILSYIFAIYLLYGIHLLGLGLMALRCLGHARAELLVQG